MWVMEGSGSASTLLQITNVGTPQEVISQNHSGIQLAYSGSPVAFIDGATRETALLVSYWDVAEPRATPITFVSGIPTIGVPQTISSGIAAIFNEAYCSPAITPVPGVSGNALVAFPHLDGSDYWAPYIKEISFSHPLITDRPATAFSTGPITGGPGSMTFWPHDRNAADYFGLASFHHPGNVGLIQRTALNTFSMSGSSFFTFTLGNHESESPKASVIPSRVSAGYFAYSSQTAYNEYFTTGYLDPTASGTHPFVGKVAHGRPNLETILTRRVCDALDDGTYFHFHNDNFAHIFDPNEDFSTYQDRNYGGPIGPGPLSTLNKVLATLNHSDGSRSYRMLQLRRGTDEIQYRTASLTVDPLVMDGNVRTEVTDWTTLEAVTGGGEPIDVLIPGDGSDKVVTVLYTGASHGSVRLATLTYA